MLGFGTLWEPSDEIGLPDNVIAPWNQYGEGNLIDQNGNYIGNYALEAYSEHVGYTQNFIPVEQDFGPGSAKSHWNYEEFDWEIMSYAQNPNNVGTLSKITIESLKDIGYDIHKRKIADVCKISEVTINKCYKKLEIHSDKLIV